MSIVQSGVQAISVLIDTWWNVNSIAFTFAFLKPKF